MKKIFFLLTLLLFFVPLGTDFSAEENDQFQVAIAPNSHQIDENISFFDLLVEPNEVIDLSLLITNTGKEKKNIKITPTNARTDDNGEIDYSRMEKEEKLDSSLTVPFTNLVDKEKIITLESGKSETVTFTLKMPEKKLSGMILGGFVISASEATKKNSNGTKDDGIYIKNEYEIRKAVRIRETKESLIPELAIKNIAFEWVNNIPALTVNIQNSTAVMFGDIVIDATVKDLKSQKVVKDYSAKDLEMAPNSNFNFPIFWYDQDIIEGNYNLLLNVTSGSQSWELTKDFSISKNESTKFSEYQEENVSRKMTWVDYLVIILSILIVLILIFVALFIIKKNKIFSKPSHKKKINNNKKRKKL